eukprot:scaffold26623_cov152-Cylindrotheca_fusiformis.AAC.1
MQSMWNYARLPSRDTSDEPLGVYEDEESRAVRAAEEDASVELYLFPKKKKKDRFLILLILFSRPMYACDFRHSKSWFVIENESLAGRKCGATGDHCHTGEHIVALRYLVFDGTQESIETNVSSQPEIGFPHVFGEFGTHIFLVADTTFLVERVPATVTATESICVYHM